MQDELVLIVDDERDARELFSRWLGDAGYSTLTAADGAECLALVARTSPAVVVLDLKIPPGPWGGMDVLRGLAQDEPELPVIIVSNKADVKRAVQCIRMGAFDFVDKQDAREELAVAVANALKVRRLEHRTRSLEEENRLWRQEVALRTEFAQLTGGSESMQAVYRLIERAAPTDASVLVLGETGTGKELVAAALHYHGRRDGPFVKVNCAALPESLLEDELFGHERGAFTGAQSRRLGRFELAHGGTILLDEVGDMSLATQAKVLRVLETREFERVGGSRTLQVDVRVVSATNQDLARLMESGRFRPDLYYRLSDIVIELPPLRDRREDIPLLVEKLLHGFGGAYTGQELAPEAMQALLRHDWPGNVRELKQVLKNACILADGPVVGLEDLPAPLGRRAGGRVGDDELPTLDQAERRLIHAALTATGGNVSQAAARLGLSWQALDRRLRKYGLDAASYR
jgi:DNA-binding NtrC family response regulator